MRKLHSLLRHYSLAGESHGLTECRNASLQQRVCSSRTSCRNTGWQFDSQLDCVVRNMRLAQGSVATAAAVVRLQVFDAPH